MSTSAVAPSFAPSSTRSAGIEAPSGPGAFVTPDGMVAYLQTRLRHVDGQLRSLMDGQNTAIRQTEALSTLTASLDACTSGGVLDMKNAEDLLRAYQDAIVRSGPDTELGRSLAAEQMRFAERVGWGSTLASVRAMDAAGTPHPFWTAESGTAFATLKGTVPGITDSPIVKSIPSEELRTFVDAVKRSRDDVSNGSEMAMLAIQSLTSQRGVATQLATSILTALADATRQITQNVGR
ncbi:MAG: hypothetical protein U0169_09550 [Polyangiaceae bacterium]